MYSDAEGSGGVGAVLVDGPLTKWWSSSVSYIRPRLHVRKTQINAFELAALFIGGSPVAPSITRSQGLVPR